MLVAWSPIRSMFLAQNRRWMQEVMLPLFVPFGRLGHAVALAHDIGLPGVEADRVRGYVFLVVKPFRDPNVSDRHGERRRGRRLRADPFTRQELGGRIEMGIDVHDLDAE